MIAVDLARPGGMATVDRAATDPARRAPNAGVRPGVKVVVAKAVAADPAVAIAADSAARKIANVALRLRRCRRSMSVSCRTKKVSNRFRARSR